MKILIVDNYSKHISEIVKSFNSVNVDVVEFLDLKYIDISSYDAYVLSGSKKYSVLSYLDMYIPEIKLINKSEKPILGICLGFELIGYTFGEKLIFNNIKINKEEEVKIVTDDPIFNNIDSPIHAYEAHRWIIEDTKFLKSLAVSIHGVEVIKHPSKLIYGLQFHPEVFTEKQQKLINNFLTITK